MENQHESSQNPPTVRIAVGGDHAGFGLKQLLTTFFEQSDLHLDLHDCGTYDSKPCDYPDIAKAVASALTSGRADRGILVCGSGVGVSVAANKIVGIRAAVCHDTYTARQGVEHDDMNVLCIGARVIGQELAKEVIRAFLGATYNPEERHARRLAKINDLEQNGLK